MASTDDKITDVRNAARPNSARVTVARLVAGTTLQCNSLVGWPTASKVHFVTYQIDSNNDPVASTQIDCSGIVVGNDITQMEVIDGTDTGNSIGDVVEMLPTAAWGQDLADALSNTLDREGNLLDDIVDTANIADSAVETAQINDNAVTTAKILDDAVTAPKVSGIAKDNLTVDSNPYKFSVYLAANQTGVADAVFTKVLFDTERFDTNSNFANNKYTAPLSGFYQFNAYASFVFSGGAVGVASILALYVNGSEVRRSDTIVTNTNINSVGANVFSDLIQLTAGDYVEIYIYSDIASGASSTVQGGAIHSRFSGFLVSRT